MLRATVRRVHALGDVSVTIDGMYGSESLIRMPCRFNPAPGDRIFVADVAPSVRVVVALGGFAWQAATRLLGHGGGARPKFGHGTAVVLPSGVALLGCYHPSQQNMFTGRLTPAMLDDVIRTAAELAGPGGTAELR